jgi:Protein of unknown function (DUF2516)
VHVLNEIQRWLNQAILLVLLIFFVWALVDCAARKAAGFPAAGKLTKPAWLGIIIITALFAFLLRYDIVFSVFLVVAPLVYLVDVRPAVREVTGGTH